MKYGLIAFLLTSAAILLTGCDNSPAALQRRANTNAARNQLFIQCVETATRPNINQYHDTSDVVEQCRISAQQLI